MFCCGRRKRVSKVEISPANKKTSQDMNGSAGANINSNIPLGLISISAGVQNGDVEQPSQPEPGRASRSMSVTSFYSVKSFASALSSATSGDKDFYSVCSEDSFKST